MKRFCCDQLCHQGRRCPRVDGVAPEAAHAACELGQDDPPQHNLLKVVLADTKVFLAVLAVLATGMLLLVAR